MTLHAVLRNQSRLRGVVLTSALINVQYTPILRQNQARGVTAPCHAWRNLASSLGQRCETVLHLIQNHVR